MKWIRIVFLIASIAIFIVISYAIINSMVSYKYEIEESSKLYRINIEFAAGYLKSQITWLWYFWGYVVINIIFLTSSILSKKNKQK